MTYHRSVKRKSADSTPLSRRLAPGEGLRASGAKVDAAFARNDAAFQNSTASVLCPNSGPML